MWVSVDSYALCYLYIRFRCVYELGVPSCACLRRFTNLRQKHAPEILEYAPWCLPCQAFVIILLPFSGSQTGSVCGGCLRRFGDPRTKTRPDGFGACICCVLFILVVVAQFVSVFLLVLRSSSKVRLCGYPACRSQSHKFTQCPRSPCV